ncbi:MAG: class beta-lactamase [Rhodoferax sp.]|nr:class beta-lactamase [Rhodoferax sp.]
MDRRLLIRATGTAAAVSLIGIGFGMPARSKELAAPGPVAPVRSAIARIERESGGRLGVAVLDAHSGASFAYRGRELFPMCSTFKFLAAALVLARCDRGQEDLNRLIAVQAADLVPYAPVTQPRVGGAPMSVAELCEAAVTLSDNVAANLLLRSFGGPEALTAFARSLDDTATRLDRIEPQLNEATAGDPRDTTTPHAMLQTMQRILVGEALSVPSRERITAWLVDNKTGDKKLRAGLPKGWRVGDKTGAGGFGTNNDIAVAWPPGRAPMLVAAYLTGTSADQAGRDRSLAEVGRVVASMVEGRLAGGAAPQG